MQQTNCFWTLSPGEAFKLVMSQPEGLSPEEATRRLKNDGANTLQSKRKRTGLFLWLHQLKNPLTLMLLVTSLLSFTLGDKTDCYIILTIVFISSLLGYWQEYGAARAVGELVKLVKTECRVRRKKEMNIPADEIVRGDIILLSAGSIIPADCLILESNELFIDEAAFTGESFPAQKKAGTVSTDAGIAGRTNSLFMGSHVISGSTTALVMLTGAKTAFGQIANNLRLQAPETDFEKGIRHFGYLLMEITLLLILIIFAVNVFLKKPVLDSFLFSIALAVGLTPQLLPAIISVNLAKGARRMAAKRVIVKKLSSIENFGSMNILCSDKTGTLTEGKIAVRDSLDINGKHCDKVYLYAWLNAHLQQGFSNPIDQALCSNSPVIEKEYVPEGEIPYDFIRKRLTVVARNGENFVAITKGAFREVLEICTHAATEDGRLIPIKNAEGQIRHLFERESEKGMRVIAVAYKNLASGKEFTRNEERDMVFLGMLTLYDPPKKEVMEVISQLKAQGIRLKIITGDNSLAAQSLVKQIGFSNPVMITGLELSRMSNAALLQRLPLADVFAEIEPGQKEHIVTGLKKAGFVVGFLGDGINDAAALHAADISISVDSAVDVAKETADIILLEHDLGVLASGIKEGRITFANTMKYVFMATSANFGNMFSMAGASVFLSFLPMLPKQILLTNLLTDLPEMTIATDKVDASAVIKPGRWSIQFIKKFMLVFGLLSSAFDYITFWLLLKIMKANEPVFQTGWFTESVISAVLIVLVIRTRVAFFKSRPGNAMLVASAGVIAVVLLIPYTLLSPLLGLYRLSLNTYISLLGVVLAYVISTELVKRWFYRKYSK